MVRVGRNLAIEHQMRRSGTLVVGNTLGQIRESAQPQGTWQISTSLGASSHAVSHRQPSLTPGPWKARARVVRCGGGGAVGGGLWGRSSADPRVLGQVSIVETLCSLVIHQIIFFWHVLPRGLFLPTSNSGQCVILELLQPIQGCNVVLLSNKHTGFDPQGRARLVDATTILSEQ